MTFVCVWWLITESIDVLFVCCGMLCVYRHCKTVVQILSERMNDEAPIDLQDLFFRYTLTSICDIAFGMPFDCLRKDHAFMKAFDTIQELTTQRFYDPFWKLKRFFKCKRFRTVRRCANVLSKFSQYVLKSFCSAVMFFVSKTLILLLLLFAIVFVLVCVCVWFREVIGQLRADYKERGRKDNMLSKFIATETKENPLTDKFLQDVMLNFVIAGRDTTACALRYKKNKQKRESSIVL